MSVSKIELDWALKQLEALEYIEFPPGDRDTFCLTARGVSAARELLESHPVCDRTLVMLLCAELAKEAG